MRRPLVVVVFGGLVEESLGQVRKGLAKQFRHCPLLIPMANAWKVQFVVVPALKTVGNYLYLP